MLWEKEKEEEREKERAGKEKENICYKEEISDEDSGTQRDMGKQSMEEKEVGGLQALGAWEKADIQEKEELGGGRQRPEIKMGRRFSLGHVKHVDEWDTRLGFAQRRFHQAQNKEYSMAHVTFAK